MAWSFNPFTGNLDLTGSSGAVVFEGEVETFADLPETVGDPPVGSSYLVRTSTGVWLVNKRQSGIWIRRNNTGVRATDWEYGGDYPVNSVAGKTGNVTLTNSDISGLGSAATANLNAISDADFRLIGSTDATKQVAIEVDTLVSAGTTRTLTVPNGNATIAAAPVSRLQQFFTSQTYNVVEGLNVELEIQNSVGSCAIVILLPRLTTDGARNGDEILIRPTSIGSGSSYTLQRYIYTGSGYIGSTETITTMEMGHTYRLCLISGVWTLLVTPNLASPPPIGSTTRNSGAFTTLNATNGTLTASAPALTVGQTWNNSGVTFSALDINVTNTASLGDSALIKATIGGTTVFQFRRDYRLLLSPSGSDALIQAGGVDWIVGRYNGTTSIAAPTIRFNTGNSTILEVGTADTIEMRRTTNPQTFRLYNTFTDASNHERLFLRWNANVAEIGTEAAGTGSSRDVAFFRGGVRQFRLVGSGALQLESTGQLAWSSRGAIFMSADGVMLLSNNAGTDFNRLAFGGTTSSFPALKRSSTTLQVRLADDSADAPLSCGALTVSGNITHTGNLTLAATSTNNINLNTNNTTRWTIGGSSGVLAASTGVHLSLSTTSFLRWGSTASEPMFKRSGTVVQTRLGDDTDFCTLQGQLRTHANAVSETITATHTLTLYDAAGTAYKVPCVAA